MSEPLTPELPPGTVLDFDGEHLVIAEPIIKNGDFSEWEYS
jgi:hypothetical protein